MDSYSNLNFPLHELIKNIPNDKKKWLKLLAHKRTKDNEWTNEIDEEKFQLICKKGHFPYEFMDDIEKLNTPIEMLTKDMFYSKLTL